MSLTLIRKSPLALFFAIGLALLLQALVSKFWLEAHFNQSQQESLQTYIQRITNTSAAQLGVAIQNEDLEALQSISDQLSQQEEILKLSLYRLNGELLVSSGQEITASNSPVSAVSISYEQKELGFLVSYFQPNLSTSTAKSNAFALQIIWLSAAISFSFIALFLFFPQLKKLFKRASPTVAIEKTVQPKSKSLLKNLLQQKIELASADDFQGLLQVKASWAELNQATNLQLLQLLNRWLPTSGTKLIDLKEPFLRFGIEKNKTLPHNLMSLYSLEASLKQLKVSPQIFIQQQDWSSPILEQIFASIEDGVWLEINSSNQNFLSSIKTLELGDEQTIRIGQLVAIDSEQQSSLNRQVRFLLEF